jgi:glycosyltransferase involved in cell wall biosynthesis
MVEAMACGIPCVVADMPGITDTIFSTDASDGMVVRQNDPAAFADAAVRLLGDPQHAAEMGRAGCDRAVAAFSIERIADSYVDLYSDLLKTGRA